MKMARQSSHGELGSRRQYQNLNSSQNERGLTVSWKCITTIFVLLAMATVVTKGGLLIARYAARIQLTESCLCNNDKDLSSTNATVTPTSPFATTSPARSTDLIDDEYVFTVVVYALLSILRILEYSLLSYGLIRFVYTCDAKVLEKLRELIASCKERTIFKWTVFWFFVLIPYMILGVGVIPAIGITQEIMHTRKTTCYKHSAAVYVAYSSVNVVRYLWDFTTRIAMIVATLVVGKVWSNDAVLSSRVHSRTFDTASSPPTHAQLASDMHVANEYVNELATAYRGNGRLVETVNEIFQTWFIFPWITYVIAASLEVGNVLQPWQDNCEDFTSIYPKMYYLAYNTNQLISLLVPYLCAKKIEADHKEYYKRMKKQRFSFKFGGTMTIQREEDYNFIPRIIGTSIRIGMRSPLYFVFLLVGFFFTGSKTLL